MTNQRDFEHWYVTNAFDYERNPLGSRECGLQRAAWTAARNMAFDQAIKACDEVDVIGADDCIAKIRALKEQ